MVRVRTPALMGEINGYRCDKGICRDDGGMERRVPQCREAPFMTGKTVPGKRLSRLASERVPLRELIDDRLLE